VNFRRAATLNADTDVMDALAAELAPLYAR
jgi:hypothetical protein